MDNKKIELLSLIVELFSFDDDIKNEKSIYQKNFFLEPFNLSPIEVVYLFEYIRKKYKLVVKKEDLVEVKFCNVENIVTLLDCCGKVEKNTRKGDTK